MAWLKRFLGGATDVQINQTTGALRVSDAETSASLTGLATAAASKLAVSVNASTQIVAANAARKSLILVNNHATVTVWLSLGTAAVSGQGIPLLPLGGSWSCLGCEYTGSVYGIAASATTVNGAEI